MFFNRLRLALTVFACVALAAMVGIGAQSRPAAPSGSLDAFMARVLEHRDEGWKKLHDYVLSETERFDITGPAGVRLNGMRREFAWYVRDGYLVRSPVRFDGVTLADGDRRRYEENWLKEEKAREERAKPEAGKGAEPPKAADAGSDPSLQDFVGQRGEPRFVSESFFLKFKFEAGNYYLAGRERLDGRDVVRVEYYPRNLFAGQPETGRERRPHSPKDAEHEREVEGYLNKVSVVTLWIDPAEYQVVRYKFDNVDFGWLPARWLVRVEGASGSMDMGPVLDGVWLPRRMELQGSAMLASGTYAISYSRELYDYKKAETSAKIRSIGRDR